MRPTSPDGAPLIGGVPGVRGLFAATGHGPWGILWAPLTGKVVAELLLDQPPSISLQRFSLRRFDTPTHRGGEARLTLTLTPTLTLTLTPTLRADALPRAAARRRAGGRAVGRGLEIDVLH